MTAALWRCVSASAVLTVAGALAPLHAQDADGLPPEIALEIEKLRPMVEEAQRLQDCLKPEMANRGLELDAAFALLDTLPDAPALRANVLRLYAQDLGEDTGGRTEAEATAGVHAPLLAYALRGAGTFDFPVIARSLSITAVYLDRALGGPCRPNRDILTFTGATARAD